MYLKELTDQELKTRLKHLLPNWTDCVGRHGENTRQILTQISLLAELDRRDITQKLAKEIKEEIEDEIAETAFYKWLGLKTG